MSLFVIVPVLTIEIGLRSYARGEKCNSKDLTDDPGIPGLIS